MNLKNLTAYRIITVGVSTETAKKLSAMPGHASLGYRWEGGSWKIASSSYRPRGLTLTGKREKPKIHPWLLKVTKGGIEYHISSDRTDHSARIELDEPTRFPFSEILGVKIPRHTTSVTIRQGDLPGPETVRNWVFFESFDEPHQIPLDNNGDQMAALRDIHPFEFLEVSEELPHPFTR